MTVSIFTSTSSIAAVHGLIAVCPAYTRNSSGDEISEHDIDAVCYIASLLIAHTAVANGSSQRTQGVSADLKWGKETRLEVTLGGPMWYHWILWIAFPINH